MGLLDSWKAYPLSSNPASPTGLKIPTHQELRPHNVKVRWGYDLGGDEACKQWSSSAQVDPNEVHICSLTLL